MLFKKSIDYPDGLEKDFFQARKALDIKERINKLDYIKVKSFCCQNNIKKKKKVESKYRLGEVIVCSAITSVSRMQISSYVIVK